MRTLHLADGVDARLLPAEAFKTNLCSLYLYLPLKRETVTKAALLARVLARGTKEYPTLTEISKKMEEMYGGVFRTGIKKKGSGEAVVFSLEFVADRYTGQNTTEEALKFLVQAATEPALRDGAFRTDYVAQEKENLRNTIEGLINDKRQYAQFKCIEHMFRGDAYGIFEYGYVEDLDAIDEKNLYDFYTQLLKTAKVDLFFSGNFEETALAQQIEQAVCPAFPARPAQFLKTETAAPRGETQRIIEEADVAQSKLSLGFTCGGAPTGKKYSDLLMMACVFGGSPVSKLFSNVREKMSLAYYVSAGAERMKSAVFVNSGIETDKFDAAFQGIMDQLAAVQNGDFSEEELAAAKKYLTNNIRSMHDNLRAMEENTYVECILGADKDLDTLLAGVQSTTREAVQQMADTVKLDTVYFLKGKGAQA